MKTNRTWKRILAFTFALVISVSAMPVLAGAAEETSGVPEISDKVSDMPVDAGTCGESATYTLDANGTLFIEGTGAVDEDAFSYRYYDHYKNIQRVVVSEGITELCDYAFYSAPWLETIKLPSTLTKIGTNALLSCYISDLYLDADPANLTWEGSAGLSRLANSHCHVPADLVDSYKNLFGDKQADFVSDLTSGVCGENAYYSVDSGGRLAIIGKGAIDPGAFRADTFAYADKIREIRISREITEIGNEAFAGYSDIAEISLPRKLRRIGDGAFSGWSSLRMMTIDDAVTYIGEDAFKGCTSLKHLNVYADPADLTWPDAGSDDFMPDTQTICYVSPYYKKGFQEKFPSHNLQFSYYKDQGSCGENAEFTLDPDGYLIISGTGSVDPGFFSAENYVYASYISWIVFDEGITGIGESAFEGCKYLDGFELPESMETIGKNAFSGCTSIDYVYVEADAANMTWEEFDAAAFRDEDDESPIIFYVPEEFQEQYTERFANSFLEIRYILDVGELDDYLGYELDNKYTLTLIGEGDVPDNAFKDYPYADRVEELIIDIDSRIPTIGANAFRDFTALKSVVFESSQLKTVGSGAFSGCTSLTSLSFKFKLESIGSEAFRGCTSLQNVHLYDMVTNIGANAFVGCNALTDLYITSDPANLTWEDPGADAFLSEKKTCCHVPSTMLQGYKDKFGSLNLTYVDYLDKGTCGSDSTYILGGVDDLRISGTGAVREGAFDKKTYPFSLYGVPVKIGEGITTIESNAFHSARMKTLFLPSTLTEIQEHAFDNTESLSDVYCYADPAKLVVGTDNFTDKTRFHVRPSMLALYQETFSDWKLIGDLTEEQVSLKANVDGKGKIICRKADGKVLQEGESLSLTMDQYDEFILEAKPEPGWEFYIWETGEHRVSYSTQEKILVSGIASQDLIVVFHKIPTPVLEDATLTHWAVVDYEKKNGIAVNAEITARSDDAYEITLTNADGKIMDIYTVDPHSAVGVNQTNAEINLPQTGVTSPGGFAAASGAFVLTSIGAAVMLGSGVFRRRKDDSEPVDCDRR